VHPGDDADAIGVGGSAAARIEDAIRIQNRRLPEDGRRFMQRTVEKTDDVMTVGGDLG